MMNHDIFISYSSKQKSIADGVCHYLEENGFRCWMAPRDIPVGSEYGDLIEEAIKKSNVIVLVFSEAASISKWVKGEINVAFSEDKPILPFRIDETEIKGGFRVMLNQMHWIDAFPQYADRLPDLLNSVCGFLGRQPQIVSGDNERLAAERKAREITERERLELKHKTEASIPTNTIGGAIVHESVNLGLPSGILWATCNLGANKSEDYGNYYVWGETGAKTVCDWDIYKYANGKYDKLTKYGNKFRYGNKFFTDNLNTLQNNDDPATANWGNGWRTPTKSEWEELLNNISKKWTTQNGVQGLLFIAKNGQTIFLPAAGFYWGNKLCDGGSYGHYWSSLLFTDTPSHAWYFGFDSDCYGVYGSYRSSGLSVRAVCSVR